MKKEVLQAGAFFPALLLAILIGGEGSEAFAGELRDYTLPSQRQMLDTQTFQAPIQQRIPSAAQTPSLAPERQQVDVYEQFRQQIKVISPQERMKLKEVFEKKAGSAGNNDEKAYYYRLISILYEYGIK